MRGEILAKLNVSPGVPITPETLEKAKEIWMELYIFFMLLTAPVNPVKHQQLEEMKTMLAEVNELIANLEV